MKLSGKTVVVGVSAGIAAYKTCYLVSHLVQEGAEVHVIMTPNARHFVDPLTFETLSGNKCISETQPCTESFPSTLRFRRALPRTGIHA